MAKLQDHPMVFPGVQRTGVVLAGGASTRMGAFKPLLSFRGRPLLAHAIDALRPHCAEILVMAGARAAEVSRVAGGCRVLGDPCEGPHVALRLAARVARHPTLLVVPADAPFVAGAMRPLLAAGPPAVVAEGHGVNPLVGLYARDPLLAALPGAPSLQVVARKLEARAVAVDPSSLRDLDDPDDLSRAGPA